MSFWLELTCEITRLEGNQALLPSTIPTVKPGGGSKMWVGCFSVVGIGRLIRAKGTLNGYQTSVDMALNRQSPSTDRPHPFRPREEDQQRKILRRGGGCHKDQRDLPGTAVDPWRSLPFILDKKGQR